MKHDVVDHNITVRTTLFFFLNMFRGCDGDIGA